MIDVNVCFLDFQLNTNENASRHEENRTTTTTRDQNMKRKLEVISLYSLFGYFFARIFFDLHMLFAFIAASGSQR